MSQHILPTFPSIWRDSYAEFIEAFEHLLSPLFSFSEDETVTRIVEEDVKSTANVPTGDKIRVSKDGLLKEKKIKHYKSSQKILLVGEGDFSFSACLAKAFGSAENMVATSLNSKDFLKKHYSNAMSNINGLKGRGCVVLHGVDATNMAGNKFLEGMKFDRIVFNFPYAGLFKKESREVQLSRHQTLVTLFFINAKKMLSEDGEIHVSHKSNGFHTEWNIEYLAKVSGLNFIKAVSFNLNNFPGYQTKYGFGGDGNFDCNPSNTYMFGGVPTQLTPEAGHIVLPECQENAFKKWRNSCPSKNN